MYFDLFEDFTPIDDSFWLSGTAKSVAALIQYDPYHVRTHTYVYKDPPVSVPYKQYIIYHLSYNVPARYFVVPAFTSLLASFVIGFYSFWMQSFTSLSTLSTGYYNSFLFRVGCCGLNNVCISFRRVLRLYDIYSRDLSSVILTRMTSCFCSTPSMHA